LAEEVQWRPPQPEGLAAPPGCLRTVAFAAGSDRDTGLLAALDAGPPVTVKGVLLVIRHPARGELDAVAELQVGDARPVRPA